ncbi:MAG TPA: glycosyltransferase family 39 protein [Verrucomicrobiae bacterium]|nr:glycosyltransferase family 39 protein [Verrucomicrobiae bacterium]
MFLAIVLILALGLRLFHLSQRVLWFDEANSLLIAKASPSQIIDAVRDDTHSPFYYMVLHYWQSVASGENGARLLSVLAGVATIVVVYALGAALAGRGAGLLAAAFLALNPLHIWYSQEIRMYAVQTLLVTLSFLLMVTALRRDQVSVWVGYLIVTALSLYAQYASFYAVIAQNGFIVIYYRHDRPKLRHWFASQCAVMLLFAPWLPVFVSQARMAASSSWLEPLTASRVLAFFSLLSGNYLGDAHGRVVSELITVVALIAPVVILWRRESRPMASMLLLWFLLPVSLLIVQSLNQNRFLPRVLLCTTPAFALMLGCAITQSGRTMARVVVTFIGVALLASNAFALRNYYFSENGWVKSDLRDATTKLAVEIEPGDIVVHLSEHSLRPFQCYLGSGVAEGVIDTPVYQSHLFAVTGDGRLPQSTAGYKRIWLVLYPDQFHRDLAETARDWMNQHHHFLRALHESNTVFVGLYERRDPQLAPTHH